MKRLNALGRTLLFLVLVGFTSCATAGVPRPLTMDALAGDWILRELGGEPVASEPPPTLTLTRDGKLSGFSGVNRFHGQIEPAELLEGHFAPGALATTRMAGSPQAMDLERRVLEALGQAESCRLQDERLVLLRGGKVVAQLAPR